MGVDPAGRVIGLDQRKGGAPPLPAGEYQLKFIVNANLAYTTPISLVADAALLTPALAEIAFTAGIDDDLPLYNFDIEDK